VKRGNNSQLCVTITQLYLVRFGVFTATSMNVPVFSDVVPYSPVQTERRFRRTYCLIIREAIEEVRCSETSVSNY
jgi:hypothetical protein